MELRVLSWELAAGDPAAPDRVMSALQRAGADVAVLHQLTPARAADLAVRVGGEHRAAPARRLMRGRAAISLILVRNDRIIEHRAARLGRLPQRATVHAVRLACGVWVAAVGEGIPTLPALPAAPVGEAAVPAVLGWAAGEPVVLAGRLGTAAPVGVTAVAAAGAHRILVGGPVQMLGAPEVAGTWLAVSVMIRRP